jgi:hypothetical protein
MELPLNTLTETDINRIITGFENGTLPKAEWTHAAHFVMALHYASQLPENELLSHIRPRIRAYNDATGTPNTDTSGYHETLTIFYIRVVVRFLKEQREKSGNTLSPVALTNLLLHSEIADRAYPLRFYNKERLFSSEARAGWVAPDREF